MSVNPPIVESSGIANAQESRPTRATAAPAANHSAGRGADGKFAKGNKGGPGNPFSRQIAAFRQAVLNAVTATDLEEIVAVLLIKAKGGDLAATKLLLAYTIGKPGPCIDPDTLDQQEWQLHQQAAVPPQQVHDLMGAMPAATANFMAQIAWPCAARQNLQPTIAALHAAEAAATAAPTSPNQEPASASADRPCAMPSLAPQRPPSANVSNHDRREPPPAEQRTRTSSRPATPRPPDLPDHIDWEYEERIMDILFSDEKSPPDTKRGNDGPRSKT